MDQRHSEDSLISRFLEQIVDPQPGQDPEVDAFREHLREYLESHPESAARLQAARACLTPRENSETVQPSIPAFPWYPLAKLLLEPRLLLESSSSRLGRRNAVSRLLELPAETRTLLAGPYCILSLLKQASGSVNLDCFLPAATEREDAGRFRLSVNRVRPDKGTDALIEAELTPGQHQILGPFVLPEEAEVWDVVLEWCRSTRSE